MYILRPPAACPAGWWPSCWWTWPCRSPSWRTAPGPWCWWRTRRSSCCWWCSACSGRRNTGGGQKLRRRTLRASVSPAAERTAPPHRDVEVDDPLVLVVGDVGRLHAHVGDVDGAREEEEHRQAGQQQAERHGDRDVQLPARRRRRVRRSPF